MLVAQGVPQGRRKKQAKGASAAFFMPKTPDVTVTKIYTDKVGPGKQTAHVYKLNTLLIGLGMGRLLVEGWVQHWPGFASGPWQLSLFDCCVWRQLGGVHPPPLGSPHKIQRRLHHRPPALSNPCMRGVGVCFHVW